MEFVLFTSSTVQSVSVTVSAYIYNTHVNARGPMRIDQRSAAAAVATVALVPSWQGVQGFVATVRSSTLASRGAVKTQNGVAPRSYCSSSSSMSQRANSQQRVFMGAAGAAGAAEQGEEAEVVVIGSGIAG